MAGWLPRALQLFTSSPRELYRPLGACCAPIFVCQPWQSCVRARKLGVCALGSDAYGRGAVPPAPCCTVAARPGRTLGFDVTLQFARVSVGSFSLLLKGMLPPATALVDLRNAFCRRAFAAARAKVVLDAKEGAFSPAPMFAVSEGGARGSGTVVSRLVLPNGVRTHRAVSTRRATAVVMQIPTGTFVVS